MQWYYDRIKDKSSELEKYPGYLPSIVRMAINLSNWYDFLKEKGLYEKTMDEIYSKRHISIGEDFEDFKQWVKDNPEYSEFIDENSTPEIDDYSDMRPVGGLNVDYFLEHAEEIINDTEHLSNPYRSHRPAQSLGRPRRGDDDPSGDGFRPGIGGVRHADVGQGQRRRRGADRHGRPPAQQSQPDERTDQNPQRHGQGHPGGPARGDAGARRFHGTKCL